MKHSVKITLILITIFFITQLFGLVTINKHIQVDQDENGITTIVHPDTVIGEAPQIENKSSSFIFIIPSFIFVLLEIRYNLHLL